jgi:hypothetical protein
LHDALADEKTLPAPYVAARDVTLAALPGMGQTLAERGLEPVTLSELFAPTSQRGAVNRAPPSRTPQ